MTATPVPPVMDWNAGDAARTAPHPGLLSRLGLPPRFIARRALKEAGARPLPAGEHARYRNLADGLASKASSPTPDLWVMEEGDPNALSCRLDRPVIAVTTSLLDGYTRTEIEAVVAHCLARGRHAGKKGVVVGYDDDVRAVALTRYPPALVAALKKAEPHRGRYASFYMVAEGPTHRPIEERIEALLDL